MEYGFDDDDDDGLGNEKQKNNNPAEVVLDKHQDHCLKCKGVGHVPKLPCQNSQSS